jgi:hypothetical protein
LRGHLVDEALPVVVGEAVFDRDDRKLADELLVECEQASTIEGPAAGGSDIVTVAGSE